MSIVNGYTTLKGYKLRFWDGAVGDHKDDPVLEKVIETASRAIDDITQKRFYATTETRYYTAESTLKCKVDHLLSVTTLKTDHNADRTYEYTWATTDYDLMPYNALLNDEPYQWIETAPLTDYYFPAARKGVEIAGSWGFSSTTLPEVEEACLLAAHRFMKRTGTPLGVSATGATGQQITIISHIHADPEIMGLLAVHIPKL